jgi:SAM-dependent methyltransferase
MSDGPVKMAPEDSPDAPALDDIILGEDDHTVPTPVHARSSVLPPPTTKDTDALARAIEAGGGEDRASTRPRKPSSNRVKAAEATKDGAAMRKRSKMTLRIPDDEVSRPQLPATTPAGGIPALVGARLPSSPDPAEQAVDDDATVVMPVRPQRIISVGAADEAPAARDDATPRRAPGIDDEQEAGWTPYQPTVADRFAADPAVGVRPAAGEGVVSVERPTRTREPLRTMIDEPGMGAMASMMTREETPSVPPVSEDIPVDTDDDESMLVTSPRLPQALDSEEIKIDDGERHTDPGEVPEVAPEDLVSVESIPNPHSPHAPPLLRTTGKHVSPSSPPAVTATSLMAGVAPLHAAPGLVPAALVAMPGPVPPQGMGGSVTVTPIAPAVVAKRPSVPAPHATNHAPVAPPPALPAADLLTPDDEHAPAAGTPMARRQQPAGGPFGFVPQVSGLAPPPMNEAAANRKKTRPWWEDLFNDDFIRTMAKITDADIAREANFIEESLGCEAGATILDLACGTGRHAVELASRGYQVVGYDLSLAMLARASDEAQERKQKINFVQGDMREMTFEETFDGVFSWNTSFGFFDEEKNAAVIAKVHRALKKGGQFLLDVVNRDNLIRSAPSLAWFEGDGCICMDEMQIDFITSRMRVKRTLMMDDGRTKEIEYSIRVYSLHELGKMLHDNGFRVAEVSGRTGTPGVFFGCESPRTLILAEKR